MSQRTRRQISEKLNSLDDAASLPFHEVLNESMVREALAAEGVKYNLSIFTPFVTLCAFLSQVLDPDHSCRAAVARVIVWMAIHGRKPCSEHTGAYCDARQRLPLGVIVRLVRQTARQTDRRRGADGNWKGRPIVLVDGATVSMPDAPRNQRAFPQSSAQGIGLGFPLARLVILISLATGVARDLALGPYQGKETGETALFRELMAGLEAGEIVVGDRVFASYFGIAGLARRGVDGVFRMHQRRKVDFGRGRCVGFEDHVVSWVKPARPDWMDEETYSQWAGEMPVRELRFRVDRPGFRVHEIVLVTTLLDAELYTKEELAELYLKRWNVELDLRSIKDVMQMDVLRCESPEMVEKEIWMHLLAYNLIRGVIVEAAREHGKQPRQISFKGALQTMTAFQEVLRGAKPEGRQRLFAVMLKAIAGHRVGNRPGRVEPRANKRRPKPQRYLTEPRREARKRLLENVL